MTSGPGVAMELMGDEAVSVWRRILNPTDSGVARKEAPPSLRAQFGTDGTRNAGHGSDSLASAERELEFFFPSTAGHGPANTANYTDCACCVIKPHVVSEEYGGRSVFCTCRALEIRGIDAPKTFRDFCGPADPVQYFFQILDG
ncbi:nucleoside diphosphate kinase 7-like isoform X2 [Coregonus clupeaformis]|uniref:nucleoside diphosphate kinase 7-like isoform X2 n=1 Tax=Coregonus clupeaformis TaxID=59861 RepID=UPI001E1C72CE|nr:nucleoside diphosphate kinase 7-like isoform X2 [Coregonus clupeaformis]